MTGKQNDTANTLFNIGSDLEENHSKLENLLDLLLVYDEHLGSEMDFVKDQNDVSSQYLRSRYKLLNSMMNVMHDYLIDVINDMRVQIEVVYAESRKAKA